MKNKQKYETHKIKSGYLKMKSLLLYQHYIAEEICANYRNTKKLYLRLVSKHVKIYINIKK